MSDDLVLFHSTVNHWELGPVTKTLPGASRPMQSPASASMELPVLRQRKTAIT